MSPIMDRPPVSAAEPVTEVLHGVSITDPYRWLEDQHSPQTREWIAEQIRYARSYLDAIPGRDRIRTRVEQLLDVESCDSLLKHGNQYFFRKRLRGQEQPGIYMREGSSGKDHLLVDPQQHELGKYAAVKPLCVSPDGRLLLYEVKHGGEYTGRFHCFDIEARQNTSDTLPRGFLRGFVFAPDSKSFYFSHEPADRAQGQRVVYHHRLGMDFAGDVPVFHAGEGDTVRLCLISDGRRIAYVVYKSSDPTLASLYVASFESASTPAALIVNTPDLLSPALLPGKILALTDRNAPNLRIVEIVSHPDQSVHWADLIPQTEARIAQWCVAGNHILVSYAGSTATSIVIFDLRGQKVGEVPRSDDETIRLLTGSVQDNEALFEVESFVEPTSLQRYSIESRKRIPWFKQKIPFDSLRYGHTQVRYQSKDGTSVPMFLMGRKNLLNQGANPIINTSYGGFGTSVTPQCSRLVSFMVEQGCIFALPCIRGGAELGADWHIAAKKRKRHVAYEDFLCAAEWLIASGRTTQGKLAIFGGSNAGLLVATAMTQKPDLFAAVLCLVPLMDMARYHLFDHAYVWRDEFGTADDPDEFIALLRYSPYHNVRPGVAYPPCLIITGDADGKCNPLHARKMTARLQASGLGNNHTLLDYSVFRGHSPVLPLSDRIESLTDRLAFLCDKLQLPI